MTINNVDDFGNHFYFTDLPSPLWKLNVRFLFDGAIEGISEEIISGSADENSLRYFGMIE